MMPMLLMIFLKAIRQVNRGVPPQEEKRILIPQFKTERVREEF